MKNQIIKKITIEIGGTEVDVTPEQARDLHEALGKLLNVAAPTQIIEKHHYDHRPRQIYWPYVGPTWTSGGAMAPTPADKWTITCKSTGNASLQVGPAPGGGF